MTIRSNLRWSYRRLRHEFGHDLGLPDEYDTQYTGQGEPVQAWSIMSGGSWAGENRRDTADEFLPTKQRILPKSDGRQLGEHHGSRP